MVSKSFQYRFGGLLARRDGLANARLPLCTVMSKCGAAAEYSIGLQMFDRQRFGLPLRENIACCERALQITAAGDYEGPSVLRRFGIS